MKRAVRFVGFLLIPVALVFMGVTVKEFLSEKKDLDSSKGVVSVISELNKGVSNKVVEISESGIEKSKKVLEKVREDYKEPGILGFMSTGEGGINEPFMWASDDRFLNCDVHGNYSEFGSIFLYRLNSSPLDEITTYYGHRLEQRQTRFSMIGKYNKYKDKVQNLDIYTDQGILHYKLVYVVVVDGKWYQDYNTWSRGGLKVFWEDSKDTGKVLDSFREFDSGKKYTVLSTCNEASGVHNAVAIYELIEEEF